jgi:pyrrolidone-carboxylate peptidase
VIAVVLLFLIADGRAMPLYRFDVRIDDLTVEDAEGRDLPDDDTAAATATALVGALVRGVFHGMGDHEVTVDVSSAGKRVLTFVFSMMSETIRHSQG